MDSPPTQGGNLVLSLFPGIDLLGRGFEQAGWCVVRGPDPAIGTGDIRSFVPTRSFTGVIGGSPCQDFSKLRRTPPTGQGLEMLRQFVRCVEAASPEWWMLENVPTVPDVSIPGYSHQRLDLRATEFGLTQSRLRHFQFGHRTGKVLILDRDAAAPARDRCVTASEGESVTRRRWEEFVTLQGLPADFELPLFTQSGRYRAVGNGVPIPMAFAIATAIRSSLFVQGTVTACKCGCGRRVTGKLIYARARCRKLEQRRRERCDLVNAAEQQAAVTASSSSPAPTSIDVEERSRLSVSEAKPYIGQIQSSSIDYSYPGSKAASGVSERIIREMPVHETYIEAFAGKAKVCRTKRPAAVNILIESNPRTVTFLESVLRFFPEPPQLVHGLAQRILPTLLQVWAPTTLLYLDPPYLIETRKRLLYEDEFETVEQHTELLDLIRTLPCMVMISGYRSALYDDVLATWRRVDIPAMTRGGMRTECLWCNFPEPTLLHDPRFAGRDYRERERINKKAKRQVKRFLAMPAGERQQILAQLAAVDRASMQAALLQSKGP